MRLVFENIEFTTVSHIQMLLEAEGIRTELRNAGSSGLAGAIPHTQVYPELWVLDHAEEDRARAIIRTYREENAAAPSAPSWVCTKCDETIDGVFSECWNCGAPDQ